MHARTRAAAGGPGGSDLLDEHGLRWTRASQLAREGELPASAAALEAALRAGWPRPSETLPSPEMRPLLDDPELRRRVRALLEEHARESTLAMVRADEPGEPMLLALRVVDGRTGAPIAGALVELVHTDDAGYYRPFAEDQAGMEWNPRLFSYARTDAEGRIEVRTIRPGHYALEYGAPDEPAHVHFRVEHEGWRPYAAELFFDDDPRLAGDALREARESGRPIAALARDGPGSWRAGVTIPLQPSR